ncbi:arabinosylfuranosidase ArfA [Massiliimalia massiliensis]|uniref:arabinosylfuranosidase ArfA n=1 Tax=Massiliimalia massiliensis TaxID=1852384 RepID=UPI000984B38C|nr:alpha-N-arabinofuranosidase [Massiliimalia massiliensis]
MLKAKMSIDRAYQISPVCEHLYDAFVEHLGRDVYGGVYDPESPVADDMGFRKDLLEMVREVRIPQVRYPGGNFASGYRWEDGVGPVENRPKRLDLAFQSLETNRIGVNEFQEWAKRAGTETMMTVNMGTRDIEAAQSLFEYCNFKGGTYWSDLRIKHGFKEPYNIKTWCLGNEMDGTWQIGHHSADFYGQRATETAKMFKWMNPDTEIIMCGTSSQSQKTLGTWETGVLEHAYDHVDLMDMHIYFKNYINDTQNFLSSALTFDRYISDGLAALDYMKAIKHSNRTINLAFNEWNVWFILEDTDARTKDQLWGPAPSLLEDYFTFEDALVVGDMLISMLKRADRVKTACISQLVNVNAPFMTEVGGARSYKQTIFYPYLHASLYGRGTALTTPVTCGRYDSKEFTDVPYLSAVTVFDEEAEEVSVLAINRSVSQEMHLSADVRTFDGYCLEEHIIYHSDDPKAHNSFDQPNLVVPYSDCSNTALQDGLLETILPAMSWNVIRLKKRK